MIKIFIIPVFLFSLQIFADAPYFVSDTCRTTQTVYSQKIQFSFDTIPAILDTIKDSAFSCTTSGCFWKYTIKDINTRVEQKIDFRYTILDSGDYSGTLTFSFFDSENDSCKFVVARFDTLMKRVLMDSIWGDIASRPGAGKRLLFSDRSRFDWVIPGIIEISNPLDTIWDTIQKNPVSISNAISDSVFYEKLQGAWRFFFLPGYGGIGKFFGSSTDSFTGYFIDNKDVYAYENGKTLKTISIGNGYGYARDGWEIRKPYPSDCQDPISYLFFNERFLFISSLVGPGTHGCQSISKVCVRDTAIKSISHVNHTTLPAQPDIFTFQIKSVQRKPSFTVLFTVQKSGPVQITLFDCSGRRILNPSAQVMQPGHHKLQIDCANLRNSIYLCRLMIGNETQTKPIVFFK